MKDLPEGSAVTTPAQPGTHLDGEREANAPANASRRSFLGTIGGATAALAVGLPLEPLIEGKHGEAEASVIAYGSKQRMQACFNYCMQTAESNKIDVGELPDNGDITRFSDYSGMWSKSLQHDGLGVPNATSWLSLANALQSGRFQDFQNVLVGTPGGHGPNSLLNGPQGCLAFDLEGRDSHATNFIPPAPSVTSAQTAAEEVEHYWGALLRDVNFTDYPTSPLAAQAAADMNRLTYLRSSANVPVPRPVTPDNLFRGQFIPATATCRDRISRSS